VESEFVRRAEPRDADTVVALVAGAGLPVDGVLDGAGGSAGESASEFFVAVRAAEIVGCCGLEVYGGDALLRSLAVAEGERGRGTGARLVERALSEARRLGLESVTLLTTSASGYFPRFGFREVGREDVPAGVRESGEFRGVCPSTATVMILRFDGMAGRSPG
jgi:amino-acid N-acetyltransferase